MRHMCLLEAELYSIQTIDGWTGTVGPRHHYIKVNSELLFYLLQVGEPLKRFLDCFKAEIMSQCFFTASVLWKGN